MHTFVPSASSMETAGHMSLSLGVNVWWWYAACGTQGTLVAASKTNSDDSTMACACKRSRRSTTLMCSARVLAPDNEMSPTSTSKARWLHSPKRCCGLALDVNGAAV